MKPGIKPATSWFLVGFVSAVPHWELPVIFFVDKRQRVWSRDIQSFPISVTLVELAVLGMQCQDHERCLLAKRAKQRKLQKPPAKEAGGKEGPVEQAP